MWEGSEGFKVWLRIELRFLGYDQAEGLCVL